MCTRYSVSTSLPSLAEAFGFDFSALVGLAPRWNVAPGTPVLALRDGPDGPEAFTPTWGFSAPGDGGVLPNARVETAGEKTLFRDALAHRRCVLPATGFFEWTGPDGDKRPHHLAPADGRPVGLAAIWEPRPDGARCVVLTRPADEVASTVHPRMPVMLSPDDARRWLADAPVADAVRDALARSPALTVRAVDPRMNDPRVDGLDVLRPPRQLDLFGG